MSNEDVEELALKSRLSEPIQPSRAEWPRWKKLLHLIDIFAFLPVPRTD